MEKEKRDYDGLLVISLLVGVVFGAAIMIAIGAIVSYDEKGIPILFGAKWWEALAAIGTSGAVMVALWQTHRLSNTRKADDNAKIAGVLSILAEAQESLSWLVEHVESSRNIYGSFEISYFHEFINSIDGINRIPFFEAPYCKYHKVLNPVISQLRNAAVSVKHVVKSESKISSLRAFKYQSRMTVKFLDEALRDPILKNIEKPGQHYF